MTNLENLGISKNRINALSKKGLLSVEDIQEFFPRKYYDFSTQRSLSEENRNQYIAVVGILKKVSTDKTNHTVMLKAKVEEELSGKTLHVMWIGSYYLKNIIKEWEQQKVMVCGELTYFEQYGTYHMNNPIVFDKFGKQHFCIYPVYKKMAGISDDFMKDTIQAALSMQREETLPVSYRDKYHLMEINHAIYTLHYPKSMPEVIQAKKRFTYEKLLNFAMEIEKEEHAVSRGTIYNIRTLKNTNDYVQRLPFSLTPSQQTVYEDMKHKAFNGIRINALVQGDVGSGKTIQK